jgi:hypothetical protein
LLLVGLHDVEGLQHSLHQLSLGGEQLLQVSVVVVARLAIALAVPCAHHLMVWENEIPRNPTICTRDMGKMLVSLCPCGFDNPRNTLR